MEAAPEITLRPFTPSDIDDVMVWASDKEASRFTSYEPFTDKQVLLRYLTDVVIPHPWYRAICLEGKPVGAVMLRPGTANDDRCRGELGYVLGSGQWGKGIMTVAVRLAVGMVFAEVEGLERVQALVEVENTASRRVLEKVGFLREGVMRKFRVHKGSTKDMVMYSLLFDEK